ncbi:sigma-54-dependent transcriptional regulator [Zavarzinia sp. CC-PAN008]|uniref:sigma-54-dependent transcriptional regulator n=1 Tax=Zavarzinia sp. CC-PAN008 TaxID=3243332 RepID=UPI003F749958
MAASILIVEDESLLARNLARFLERRGHQASIAATLAEGRTLYAQLAPDLVLTDYSLPDGTGLELIGAIRETDHATKIVMITAHGGVGVAVDAMKRGCDDYLTKPMALDEVGLLVDRLLSRTQAEESLAYYRRREERMSGVSQVIGTSAPMAAMKQRIAQIVAMQARQVEGPPPPVLITGETGTGKELVARALHFDSARRAGPFVEINCAALPEHLIESELFGHEKGAFTDARERRIGLIQSADGGTLFLDEIGEMPLAVQAKLLKVLEDYRLRPLGAVRERTIDVRFVAATNVAIEDRAHSGEFRADLFYRLRGLSVPVPPLRERGDDIALLAEHFLAEHRRRYGRPGITISAEALAALARHSWPGNVRELRNVMEQAALLTVGDTIKPDDLALREPPPLQARTGEVAPAGASLQAVERDLIVQALQQHQGNVTLAAQVLGISRDTMRYRMEKHRLRRESFA